MDETRYYQPSGAVPILGLVLGSAVAIFLATICGFVFGVVEFYNPIIYVNFLGAFFVPAMVGNAVRSTLIKLKVRNWTFSMLLGLLTATAILYSAWWAYVVAVVKWELLSPDPTFLWGIIGLISDNGVWSIKRYTPTGVVLWILWAIEAGAIYFFTMMSVLDTPPPFCEDCDQVTTQKIAPHPFSMKDSLQMRDELEDGRADLLLASVRDYPGANCFLRLTVNACPTCDESYFAVIETVTITVDNEGKSSSSNTTTIPWIKVDAKIVAELEALIALGYFTEKVADVSDDDDDSEDVAADDE